ncbi:DUF1574 domain-containing protein [Leptospira langatensis]|uniref:DUF1574 domain-containing protein n=1 Tax=Leptospira langatensis TaxID=2484983 RepID=A0A5F1ZPC3_9LEPT|nr:D-alanyl-lipoteichoic acid biosynthesis protein DltD [Leptospira langatensis]TGK05375.1 DUF1574 domain-containing protein [Leptospira langatensis]TGL38511.1 DUF1574 domain-containing protein [Leptospira langatensis]
MNPKIQGKGRRFQKLFIFLIPGLALFSYLLADKILIIDPVRTTLASYRPYDAAFASLIHNDDLTELEYVKARKVFLAAGTSRSMNFSGYPNLGYTLKDPFLTPEAREILKDWEGVSIGMQGASMSLIYVRLLQAIERGWKPDLVLVEVTKDSFSDRRKFKEFLKQNVIPLDYGFSHWRELGLENLWEITYPRIFLAYKYRFSPKNLITYIKGDDLGWGALMIEEMERGSMGGGKHSYSKKHREEVENRKFEDYNNPDASLGEVYRNQFVKRRELADEEQGGQPFRVDQSEYDAFVKIIRLLQDKKIPALYWSAKVHRILQSFTNDEASKKEFKTKIEDTLKSYGERYLDANEFPMKCNYYQDANHLSERCYTELASFLLKDIR